MQPPLGSPAQSETLGLHLNLRRVGGRRSYDEDILSQCNTQLIFRMVSAEDLAAVAGCFEQASEQLLRDLPQ